MKALTDRQVELFWSRVDRDGPIVRAELGPCWLWMTRGQAGGGRGKYPQYRGQSAHRYAWSLTHGEPPARGEDPESPYLVLHRCDSKYCVNPAHLYLGTDYDNALDRWHPGRARAHAIRPDRVALPTHVHTISGGARITIPRCKCGRMVDAAAS